MNRSARNLLVVVVALVVVLGGIVFFVVGNLDSIVKAAIEKVAPEVTGTRVTVGGVSISLQDGSGEIRNLVVHNPSGFDTDHALRVGLARVVIDASTVTQDVIRIREITVDGASMIAEQKGRPTDFNLTAILDHVKSQGGGSEPAPAESGGSEKKLVIERFNFTGTDMRLVSELAQQDVSVTVPDIRLANIGESTGGATSAQVAEQILRPLIDAAVKQAKDNLVKGKAKELEDKAKDRLRDLIGNPGEG